MASVVDAFSTAATALEVVGELSISSRQINKLAEEAGTAMATSVIGLTMSTFAIVQLAKAQKSANDKHRADTARHDREKRITDMLEE